MKKVYISGPMAGIKNYNYPLFNATADYLETMGFLPINPARHPIGLDYEAYMEYAELDVKNCDLVAFLPGYKESTGAMRELGLANVYMKGTILIEDLLKCHSN